MKLAYGKLDQECINGLHVKMPKIFSTHIFSRALYIKKRDEKSLTEEEVQKWSTNDLAVGC